MCPPGPGHHIEPFLSKSNPRCLRGSHSLSAEPASISRDYFTVWKLGIPEFDCSSTDIKRCPIRITIWSIWYIAHQTNPRESHHQEHLTSWALSRGPKIRQGHLGSTLGSMSPYQSYQWPTIQRWLMENRSTEILPGVPLWLGVMNPVQKFWTAFPHVQPPTGSNGRAQTQPSFWRCFKQTHVHLHLQFRNPDHLHPKPSLQAPQQAFVPSYIYTSKKARLQPQCSCTDSKKIVWALELIGTYLGLFNNNNNNNNSNNNNGENNKLSQNHTVSFRGGLYPVSRQNHRSGCCCHQLCNSAVIIQSSS